MYDLCVFNGWNTTCFFFNGLLVTSEFCLLILKASGNSVVFGSSPGLCRIFARLLCGAGALRAP